MGWIDINEQTPPPNEYILINTRVGVTIAKYDGRGRSWGIVSQPDEPLAYSFYNMQTELLSLDDSERASFMIHERVTHWMLLPERPDVDYKIPREWSSQEQNEYNDRQLKNMMDKYSPENNALFMEMMNKIYVPEPSIKNS